MILFYFILLSFQNVIANNSNELNTTLTGTRGVDMSSLVSVSGFQCLSSNEDVTFVIPRGYRSSGSVDTNVCSNLNNAKSADIATRDVYMFPCPLCSSSAASQMNSLISYLHSNCNSAWSGRIWLDIEGSEYWSTSTTTNRNWYQELVTSCSTYSVQCGVYASKSQWQAIFGSSTYCYGQSYPLWYAHYDGDPSFTDYPSYSFGCWSVPYAKQYKGTTSTSCGLSVDLDSAEMNNPTGCTNKGYYCGNDGLGLDSNSLYYCSGTGSSPILSSKCSFTCVTMPKGTDDKCDSSSGSCSSVNTGYYCGNDKINGDSTILYLCENSKPDGAQKCSSGCYVASSGSDDYCK